MNLEDGQADLLARGILRRGGVVALVGDKGSAIDDPHRGLMGVLLSRWAADDLGASDESLRAGAEFGGRSCVSISRQREQGDQQAEEGAHFD